MTVRLFKGGDFDHTEERKQIDRVLKEIISTYQNDEETCYIFLDFKINRIQFDILMIKKNSFIIIECKNKSGRIKIDVDNNIWEFIYNDGVEIIDNRERKTPNTQVMKQKGRFYDVIEKVFLKIDPSLHELEKTLINDKYRINKQKNLLTIQLLKMIKTYIVIGNNSTIENKNGKRFNRGIRIIEEEALSRELLYEASQPDFRFENKVYKFNISDLIVRELITELNNQEYSTRQISEIPIENFNNWLMNPKPLNENIVQKENLKYRFNQLDLDIRSNNESTIKKAIEIINYLQLGEYLPDIIKLSESKNPSIRYLSIKNVIELEDDYNLLTEFLIPFLEEKDVRIRNTVVEALMKYGTAKVVPKITKILKTTTDKKIALEYIEILRENGDERSIETLINFYNDINNRFESEIRGTILREYDEDNQEEFIQSELDRIRISIIETLGEIGSINGLEFLLKEMEENDDYVKDNIIIALGQIGDKRAVLPLINLANQSNFNNARTIDTKFNIIKSLGMLKAKEALPLLHSYFGEERCYLDKSIIRSLKQIASQESFDILYKKFETGEYGIKYSYDRELFDALVTINEEELEKRLLNVIKQKNNEKEKGQILVTFFHISSKISIDTLINLIKNGDNVDIRFSSIRAIFSAFERDYDIFNDYKKTIYAFLSSDDPVLRRAGIQILSVVEKEKSIDKLVNLCDDPSFDVVREVLDVFIWLRNDKTLKCLIKLSTSGRSQVAEYALDNVYYYLKEKHYRGILENSEIEISSWIKEYVMGSNFDEFRKSISSVIEIIGYLWGEKALPLFEKLLSQKEYDKDIAIIYACEKINSTRCVPLFIEIIKRKERDMRHDLRYTAYSMYRKIEDNPLQYEEIIN